MFTKLDTPNSGKCKIHVYFQMSEIVHANLCVFLLVKTLDWL